MNIYKSKAFPVAVKAYKWASRHHTFAPRQVKVETERTCNLRCTGCRRAFDSNISHTPGQKHLTLEHVQEILRQVPTARVIRFGGDGEHMANPYLLNIYRYLHGNGLCGLLAYHGLKVEACTQIGYGAWPFGEILRGLYAANVLAKARRQD